MRGELFVQQSHVCGGDPEDFLDRSFSFDDAFPSGCAKRDHALIDGQLAHRAERCPLLNEVLHRIAHPANFVERTSPTISSMAAFVTSARTKNLIPFAQRKSDFHKQLVGVVVGLFAVRAEFADEALGDECAH